MKIMVVAKLINVHVLYKQIQWFRNNVMNYFWYKNNIADDRYFFVLMMSLLFSVVQCVWQCSMCIYVLLAKAVYKL